MSECKNFNQSPKTLLLYHYHRNAYNLVLLKRGDMLYDGVSDTIKQKAENSVKIILNSGMGHYHHYHNHDNY